MNLSRISLPGCLVLIAILFLPIGVFPVQEKHEHSGILNPYSGEPPIIHLDEKERQRLEQGRTVFKYLSRDSIKSGVIIFRVAAPVEVVWSVIRDFNSYPDWIDGVDETEIYREENGHTYVHFEGHIFFLGKLTWYVDHAYPQGDRNWGTWTLDYDHVSDIEDTVGFWRVQSVDGNPGVSEVTYSANIKLRTAIPGFIERMVVKSQIKKATHWVTKNSEAQAGKQ